MGLQIGIAYKGINIENGYAKIVAVEGNKNRIFYNVEFYVSKDIADADINNQQFLDIKGPFIIVPEMVSELNLWQQMYANLKTLPQFQGAVDV